MSDSFPFMSESTEELKTAVQGLSEALTETATQAEQLSSQATELSDEAAEHGWHGIAGRMQEVAEALEATSSQITAGVTACETAAQELALINDKIPAKQVVGHLGASTNHLGDAGTSLQGAVEKAEEAQMAAAEIGQEGMMQATSDLYNQLTTLQDQIEQYRSTSEQEHSAANVYAKKQAGN
jgi:flagellar biosynthesis chaperone FliJ